MRGSSGAVAAPKDSAPVFAALGDKTRLRLISRLCDDGPMSITRLTTGSKVTRQAITKHLRALADAGLVHDTRRGRERIWEFCPKRIEKARAHLEYISQQWDAALGRLQDFLRENP